MPGCPNPPLFCRYDISKRTVTLYAPDTGAQRRQRRRLLPHRQTPQQAMAAYNQVRCECGSIARGVLTDDNRCTETLDSEEFHHGRTLCYRCRPPDCLVISRGRMIARNLEGMIQFSGLQFEPPLNFEMSRRRQIGILLLNVHPRCHCPCGRPQNVPHQPEQLTLRDTMNDPQLAQDDLMAASCDFEVMLVSRLLGYSVWSLESWVPDGRREDWTARQRSDWPQLEASMDPNRTSPWLLD